MNPMQKYTRIVELFACTRRMLAFMFLFSIKSVISSETNTKTVEINNSLLLQNKAIQCVPTYAYSSRFIIYPLFFQAYCL